MSPAQIGTLIARWIFHRRGNGLEACVSEIELAAMCSAAAQAAQGGDALKPIRDAMAGMHPEAGRFVWTVAIEVDPSWVADGFNLTPERLADMLMRELGDAREGEVRGTVLTAPKAEDVSKAQGS